MGHRRQVHANWIGLVLCTRRISISRDERLRMILSEGHLIWIISEGHLFTPRIKVRSSGNPRMAAAMSSETKTQQREHFSGIHLMMHKHNIYCSVHPGEGSSVALLKVSSLFFPLKGCLAVFPDPMWGFGAGMSVCTDCKALRDKFVICEIGLYK